MAWEYVLLFCSLLNLNMSYILELSTLHGFFKKIYILKSSLRALSPNCLSLFAIKCTFTSATVQWMNSEWINCEIKVIFLYIKSLRIPKYHYSVTIGMILIHAKRGNIQVLYQLIVTTLVKHLGYFWFFHIPDVLQSLHSFEYSRSIYYSLMHTSVIYVTKHANLMAFVFI